MKSKCSSKDSTYRDIFNFVHRRINCKYFSAVFPLRCGLILVFVCAAWVVANSVFIGSPYVFVTVVDRIPSPNTTVADDLQVKDSEFI